MKSVFTLAVVFMMSMTAWAQSFNVTFSVDMNEVTDPFTTPEVNGSWDGWCGGCTPMSDPDGDGIWTVTKTLDAGYYEYKFAFDSWTGDETLVEGSPCTVTSFGFTNRFIDVTADVELGTVCYGACTSCAEAESYSVTFQVNMNDVVDPYTTPEVNGNWDGWCGGCTPLEDPDGDGIWTTTKTLSAGSFQYKFAADAWTISENLIPGSDCTVTIDGFTNRIIDVAGDTVLPVVCYGSCSDCGEAATYDVTFQVNMNEVADPFTTPEVNGTFNGWCGGCNPLEDPDGDGIWSTTITLEEGFYEYKYAADGWTIQEELTPGDPCTMTTDIFTNRTLDLTGDVVLDVVCWNLCEDCPAPVCELPTGLTIEHPGGLGTEAIISWSPSDGATQYGLRYREVGTPTWNKKATTGTSVYLIELTPGTEYQYQMVVRCGEDRAGPGPMNYFTTPARFGQFDDQFAVYPNPSNGIFQLAAGSLSENASLIVVNAAGQQVHAGTVLSGSQMIDLSFLADGLYTMVISNGQTINTQMISIIK